MKQNVKNNNGSEKVMTHMVMEKKKVLIALCLVAIMVFMWARVIMKKSPEAAKASEAKEQNDVVEESGSDVNVTFVELPNIEGRNDVITRDFFASNGWNDFFKKDNNSNDNIEVNVISESGREEIERIVKEKLKLEAVGLGGNPRALINDKMLSVGEKISILDGNREYECEVIEIKSDSVVISCQETEVTLKLKQMIGNSQ